MKKHFILPVLLAALHVSAHADTAPAKPVKIGITDNKGSTLGLSFTPPDESGWKLTRSGLSAKMTKEGESAEENREIEAYLINLEAPATPISGYIERIRKNTLEGYANHERFKIKAFEINEDPKNSRCARIHLLLEDSKAENTQQKKWSEQYMISCGSLRYKRFGFEVRYYHRYYESHKDNEFASRANTILDSVVIED